MHIGETQDNTGNAGRCAPRPWEGALSASYRFSPTGEPSRRARTPRALSHTTATDMPQGPPGARDITPGAPRQ